MKICVGLSGGVDSSVAALLLKRQGYDVFAMFMQNWHDADATLHGDCEWEEDRFVAELVARKIGIPFYFVDLSKEYRQRVVDYMFNEYSAGRTPNPDVLCNREIKFDAFLKAAQKLGADMVATGHYCRRAPLMDAEGKQVVIDGLPQWRILEGVDPNKDQSYFLCQLTQEQLGKALFPIGNLTKPEVREIAREADLPSADKKDSQGICFVGKVDLPTFLQQKLKPAEGNVVEVYDAYYAQSEQYRFVHDTLASLLETPGEPMMITEYTSEDSGGKPFNNRRVTDNNSPVTEPATPRHSDKLSPPQVQQPQSLSVTEPVEVTKSTGKTDWSEYGSEASALPSQSRLACGDPHVHEATGGHGAGNAITAASTATKTVTHHGSQTNEAIDINTVLEQPLPSMNGSSDLEPMSAAEYKEISKETMAAFSSEERTRSFLKVQDGCNNFCAYCTVPYARGNSRNIPISEVLEQARRIAGAGIKEIVITGVNTGDFGRTTGESFLDLLKRLNDVEGIERYRISSIEPNLITEDIVDWIASGTKFQPHFHIPLQSGSDTILKRAAATRRNSSPTGSTTSAPGWILRPGRTTNPSCSSGSMSSPDCPERQRNCSRRHIHSSRTASDRRSSTCSPIPAAPEPSPPGGRIRSRMPS